MLCYRNNELSKHLCKWLVLLNATRAFWRTDFQSDLQPGGKIFVFESGQQLKNQATSSEGGVAQPEKHANTDDPIMQKMEKIRAEVTQFEKQVRENHD